MLSIIQTTIFGLVAANDACYSCFGTTAADAANLSVSAILKSTKYFDPASGNCGDEKNDGKQNLIFKNKDSIPKTWIFNPQHCDVEEFPVDLKKAEEAWVLSQLSYASSESQEHVSLTQCIDERYAEVLNGEIKPSQAETSQFKQLTNVKMIERSDGHKNQSQEKPSKQNDAGPIGVFWADKGDDELLLVWRGTTTHPQLGDEIKSIAVEYLKPTGKSFVDVHITTPENEEIHVGGAFDYFFSNFVDLWNDPAMQDFKDRAKKAQKISLVGHSLGGALASIAALYIAVELGIPGSKIEFLTFGEPRLSDSTFAVNMNTLIRNQKRFVYSKDLVPHVPPMEDVPGVFYGKYRYPQGKESAFHHSQEVFLPNHFWKQGDAAFSSFHSCGFDDRKNEKDEDCSNSVTDLATITDLTKLINTIKHDKQALDDHVNYWPQYRGICDAGRTTPAPQLII